MCFLNPADGVELNSRGHSLLLLFCQVESTSSQCSEGHFHGCRVLALLAQNNGNVTDLEVPLQAMPQLLRVPVAVCSPLLLQKNPSLTHTIAVAAEVA